MAHDVFISYSHVDAAVADAVCHELESNGIRCWYAPRNVEPGQSWAGAIVGAIRGCRVFVLIFSGNSNSSQQVVNEITNAVNFGKIIVPFRIDQSEMSDEMTYYLSSRHWLDAVTPPLIEHIRALRDQLGRVLDIPSGKIPFAPDNPYSRRAQPSSRRARRAPEEQTAAGEPGVPVPAAGDELVKSFVSEKAFIHVPVPDPKPVQEPPKNPASRRKPKDIKPAICISTPVLLAPMAPLTRPIRPRQVLTGCDGSVIGVSKEGKVVCHCENYPNSVRAWEDLKEVSESHCAITGLHRNGTVSVDFNTLYPTMGESFARLFLKKARKWTSMIQVRSGEDAVYGLRKDGHVLCASIDADERKRVEQWRSVVALTTAGGGVVGLKSDGTIVSTMRNCESGTDQGSFISFADWKDIVSIAGGKHWLAGLKSDGTVEFRNNHNPYAGSMTALPAIKEWNRVIRIAAGDKMILGLRDDGTILCAGFFGDKPPDFSSWKNVMGIAVDQTVAIAYGIRWDGSVICTSEDVPEVSGWVLQRP